MLNTQVQIFEKQNRKIVRRSQHVCTPTCHDGEGAPVRLFCQTQRICVNSEDQRGPGSNDLKLEQKPAGACFRLQDHRKTTVFHKLRFLFYLFLVAR